MARNIIFAKNTIAILKLLAENKKMYRKEIIMEIIGKEKDTGIEYRLRELEILGIIESEIERKFQRKKWYVLSSKGKKIIQLLIEIEKNLAEIERILEI